MTAPTGHELGELLGEDAAPPRSNGELVFEAPWHGRAFGIAVALADGGHLEWDRFRDALIASIAAWELENGERDDRFDYYRHWVSALEATLVAGGSTTPSTLDRLVSELATSDRHEDHDHTH